MPPSFYNLQQHDASCFKAMHTMHAHTEPAEWDMLLCKLLATKLLSVWKTLKYNNRHTATLLQLQPALCHPGSNTRCDCQPGKRTSHSTTINIPSRHTCRHHLLLQSLLRDHWQPKLDAHQGARLVKMLKGRSITSAFAFAAAAAAGAEKHPTSAAAASWPFSPT